MVSGRDDRLHQRPGLGSRAPSRFEQDRRPAGAHAAEVDPSAIRQPDQSARLVVPQRTLRVRGERTSDGQADGAEPVVSEIFYGRFEREQAPADAVKS